MKLVRYVLVLALVMCTVSYAGAGDYEGYPDWASETFSDADDKGAP